MTGPRAVPAGPLGAIPTAGGTRFLVWAPRTRSVDVHLLGRGDRVVPMAAVGRGYYEALVAGVAPGARYLYRLDGVRERPDPASRLQPEGVHGPSEVVAREFSWTDAAWRGVPLSEYILYELHLGTFTPAGTCDAAIGQLDALAALGVTAVEVMPVAQFPGERNWGYDGVDLFAAHTAYGGPAGLKRFVDACHARGLAAVLDVVYNHLGPEGNYLSEFGPYFTDRRTTPWGEAVNVDGPDSDEVRRFFIDNALMWVDEFHFDALRLDAVHAILDQSARPFLAELGDAVHAAAVRCGRDIRVIAESNLNDPRFVRPGEVGGLGLDTQWSDDLHHAVHAALTGERWGYYADYDGGADVARALRDGFVFDGRYSRSRRRRYGAPANDLGGERFVVAAQTHDQVGNRPQGDRLAALVPFEALKLAAGIVLLSPYLPLLFMGEEYAEPSPFLYFTSHGDPHLAEAVRRGRREMFAAWDAQAAVPDPQDPSTFARSKLRWSLRHEPPHAALLAFYTELIRLRRTLPALSSPARDAARIEALEDARVVVMRRGAHAAPASVVFNLSESAATVRVPLAAGRWAVALDSADRQWGGPGRAGAHTVESDGTAAVPLRPQALVLLARADGA
jgi:maltooligosyltrehalose trehalohydrolase